MNLIFLRWKASFRSARHAVQMQEAEVNVEDLSPQDVAAGIAAGRYLLVDVREPNEVQAEAYPDSVVLPLSGFDPSDLPDPKGREVVFAC